MTGRLTSFRLLPLGRGAAAVLVVLLGAPLVAGCAGSLSSGGNSLGAQALQNPSQFEERVLKDKHVTQAEFDESMQVYTECLAAAGLQYEVSPAQVGMGSVFVYHTGRPGPDSDNAEMQCVDKVSAVQNVWTLQNHLSTADLESRRATYIACLRDAGLPISDGASFEDANSAMSAFIDSLSGKQYDDASPLGKKVDKVFTCRRHYQRVSGAQPLPGLKQALETLDTSGW